MVGNTYFGAQSLILQQFANEMFNPISKRSGRAVFLQTAEEFCDKYGDLGQSFTAKRDFVNLQRPEPAQKYREKPHNKVRDKGDGVCN